MSRKDGGMTMQAFADLHGLTKVQALSLASRGKILGARKDDRTKKWRIYPPAKLVDKSGDTMKRREPAACQPVEKLPAVAQATPDGGESFTRDASGGLEVVDVGTSPHGLSADQRPLVQETREGSSNRPSCKAGFNAF